MQIFRGGSGPIFVHLPRGQLLFLELHSSVNALLLLQSPNSAPSSPPITRVKNKRYKTEHALKTVPFEPVSKATRAISISSPDLLEAAATGNEASPLVGCRYSVAAQASALELFDDLVEEPAADVDMHIPNNAGKGGKKKGGYGKKVESIPEDTASSASANTDQSHEPDPST